MGHPRRQRRGFKRPKRPFDKERITSEKKIVNEFGLRRKRELWTAEATLRNYRRRARALLTNPDEVKRKELLDKLRKTGFNVERLDDVLTLKLENLLARRLQTVVYKKGYAKSLKEARQLIVHRNVLVGDKRVWYPGYLVESGKESEVDLVDKIKARKLKEESKLVKETKAVEKPAETAEEVVEAAQKEVA